jgi:acyl-coenzyme A thioesterase PaaI-like protein
MQAVCFQSFASVTAMAVNVAVEGSLVQRTWAAATVGRVTTLSEFDRATAVTARDGHAAPPGAEHGTMPPGAEHGTMAPGAVHDVRIDPGWTIGDKPNGGYLLAAMARAALDAVAAVEGPDHPHPLSATATYVRPPTLAPAEIHSEILRRGRGMSQVRARLVQDDAVRVEASFTVGRLRPDAEPFWGGAPRPALPERDGCERSTPAGPSGMVLPIMERVDIRFDPDTIGFRRGAPSGRGDLRAWLAFADGRAPDPLALLYALDALPPATFDLAEATGWVPTLSLTAYLRALPAPGPLVVRQRAGLVEGGLVDEVCEVWDGRGRLVAHGTQLAAVRTRSSVR